MNWTYHEYLPTYDLNMLSYESYKQLLPLEKKEGFQKLGIWTFDKMYDDKM